MERQRDSLSTWVSIYLFLCSFGINKIVNNTFDVTELVFRECINKE